MSSTAGQAVRNVKTIDHTSNNSSSSPSSFQGPTYSIEGSSQRRSGGNGSFGAGSTTRNNTPARNNQARKGQHKKHNRPALVNEDAYSETAIMKSTTSRKGQTSITHLMNFSLPPRPQYHPSSHRPRRNQTWGGSGYHAGDKARYVHANYRFIVNPQGSYHAQAANADVHLDWDSVLQVLASEQTQAASCPICLSMPVAPRMAKCGHIFCFPCLIRYMHSTDDDKLMPEKKARWQKCPICWDTIYVSDTRPVHWFIGQEADLPFEGSDVVLRLVKRNPGSTLALPRDGAEDLDPQDDIPWYHAAEVADYARIMKGGEDYMTSQYDSEIEELNRQRQEDELLFGDDATWVKKAIHSINDARDKIRGLGNPPPIVRAEKKRLGINLDRNLEHLTSDTLPTDSRHELDSGAPKEAEHDPSTSNNIGQVISGVDTLNLNDQDNVESRRKDKGAIHHSKEPAQRGNASATADQPYYFYQCLPHFYLSPLDIRILKAAFGEYSSFPATILPRVEHISTGHVVDDELRKRTKYLGHLPYGCEVSFLECDWTDTVAPEVLGRFRTEINKRRQRNRDKEAREEKDRIRAEKEEDEKRWAAARRKRPSFGISDDQRPFSDRDFLPLTGSTPGAHDSAVDDTDFAENSPPSASQMHSRFEALVSPSSSPPVTRTVWGTAAVNSDSPVLARRPVNDGWLRGWEEDLMGQREAEFIAQATADAPAPSTGGGGKKKKNKKITLMSTNIQRGA